MLLFFNTLLPAAEPEQITYDGSLKLAPTFTAGGQEIVYAVHNIPTRVSLMRLKLKDGSQELVYPDLQVHQFDPAYSPDGHWGAFSKSSGSPQLLLVIRNEKEQSEAIFTPQGARSTARTPSILPDGSRVVFTLSAPGGQQICSVNMQAGDLQRLTQSTGINCWPDVSPDGRRIVFSSSRAGHLQLYTMNADGTNVQRLTDSPVRDTRPAFSPDGSRIAFTSLRDGNHEIYIINADGSNPRRVTHHPERDDFAVWHPDGKRLLIVSQRTGQHDLWFVDVSE